MKFKLTESVLTTRGRILTNIPKTSDVQQNQTFNTTSVILLRKDFYSTLMVVMAKSHKPS